MNGERSCLEALSGADLMQIGIFQQAVLFQFVFQQSQGELRAPHRHIEFGKNPGQSADVVFMTMGEDDGAHALPVFDQIGNVRNHDVHAQ